MKKNHQVLKCSTSKINSLSLFSRNSEHFLCSGDKGGDLRIFVLNNDLLFDEKFLIKTKFNIFDSVIIEDKYRECSINKAIEGFERILVIISFKYKIPVRIYNLSGEILRFIPDFQKEPCGIINFYYDEIVMKTSLFFGFKTYIKQLDLTSNEWIMDFHTMEAVYSIQFCLEFKKNVSRLIIYTQNITILTIANIDTENVLRQVTADSIKDINRILDICLWKSERNYVIIVAKGEENNHIKIFNFEDLKFLNGIKKKPFCPVNIRKVKIKDSQTQKIMESLISFEIENQASSNVTIYE